MADEFKPDLSKRVKNWILDSLSGFNITARIQLSIRAVLGLGTDEKAPMTELENKLVNAIEAIARRGKSPLILFEDDQVWSAFFALARQFPGEKTTIMVRSGKGDDIPTDLEVFPSLLQYAQAIRSDDIKVQEYKRLLGLTPGIFEKRRLNNQVEDLKSKIAERTALFQKIIFAEADRVERGELFRVLSYQGRSVRLDDLLRLTQPAILNPDVAQDEAQEGPPLSDSAPFKTEAPAAPEPLPILTPKPKPSPYAFADPGPALPTVTQVQPKPKAPNPTTQPPAPKPEPPEPQTTVESSATPAPDAAAEKPKSKLDVLDWNKLREETLDLDDSDSFKLDF